VSMKSEELKDSHLLHQGTVGPQYGNEVQLSKLEASGSMDKQGLLAFSFEPAFCTAYP